MIIGKNGVSGIYGTLIGFCQGLFQKENSSREHTAQIVSLLEKRGVTWAQSHQLLWRYRYDEFPHQSAIQYFCWAADPLLKNGSVPVIYTGLNPFIDQKQIAELFSADSFIADGETILVRLVLSGEESFGSAGRLLNWCREKAITTKVQPPFLPLFQANLSIEQWQAFMNTIGDDLLPLLNIVVNPFTLSALDCIKDAIVVAQVPIGLKEGIEDNGTVALAPGMNVFAAHECATYSVPDYFAKLAALQNPPTLILCGASQSDWTQEQNCDRAVAGYELIEKFYHEIYNEKAKKMISDLAC